jgi:hypothetical protein
LTGISSSPDGLYTASTESILQPRRSQPPRNCKRN